MARAIMVSDSLYAELLSLKGVGESFTKVIGRFIHGNEKKNEGIMQFAGAWSSLSKEKMQSIEKGAKSARKQKWRAIPKW